ncbi:MAG: hypothetical protein PHD61_05890 [Bacteroidales bacterium]|nr:hypothetical protein [Lentimicrobiaceae bacterium]MDD5694818.1 hypothetical protein [Bacteroidales bacterium]
MRTTLFSFILILSLFAIQVHAQDVSGQLNTATASYTSGDLENARFSLQEALNGVNQALGKEILDLLPGTLGGMNAQLDADNVTGTNMGFAGLYVNRDYQKDTIRDASLEIISDSPMLATVNSLLTMSTMFSSDPNQKRIKIGSYKALMTKSESNDIISYDIQMPFGNSMMTFKTNGIADEAEVTGLVNSLPITDIVRLAQ